MLEFNFTSKELLDKGWSCDKKYCVTAEDGTKYLLRITPESKDETCDEMYQMQKRIAALEVPMCEPIDFGTCDEGVYLLQSWINGEDAEEVVPHFADSCQYTLGMEAGRILKKIHSIPAPENQPDWETRFNAKIDRSIANYRGFSIKHAKSGSDMVFNIK